MEIVFVIPREFHSWVEAAGESGAISFAVEEYIQEAGYEDYEDLLKNLDPETVSVLAERYRKTLAEMGVHGQWVTEKSINNMKMAELLYIMFPEARFVQKAN